MPNEMNENFDELAQNMYNQLNEWNDKVKYFFYCLF